MLNGNLGEIILDNAQNPNTAVATIGFVFASGQPNLKLLERSVNFQPNQEVTVIPSSSNWRDTINKLGLTREFEIRDRTTFKPREIDVTKLMKLFGEPPVGFQIDQLSLNELKVAAAEINNNLFGSFWEDEQWNRNGVAFGVREKNNYVCASSAFAAGENVIEIEIATKAEHRRKGLAACAASHLIKFCVENEVQPSWDAANAVSERLAKRLGFIKGSSYSAFVFLPQ